MIAPALAAKRLTAELGKLGACIRRGGLTRNALISFAQPLTGMVCVFGAYRILTEKVGVEGVGLWSLLVAGSFFARVADFSGGSGLVRFVAAKSAQENGTRAAEYVHTVILTTLVLNVVISIVLYASSGYLVARFVAPKFVNDAHELVPFAILSVVMLPSISLALCSGIDGVQRADQRAMIVIVSSFLFLGVTWNLTPRIGASGFGTALIVQQLFTIVATWATLRLHIPQIGLIPWRWRRDAFVETTGFGLKMQANALATVLTEPVAKGLLSQWGGLASVADYEFATRLVYQIRGPVIAATQPLLAVFATFKDGEPSPFHALLLKSTRIITFAAVALTVTAVVGAPLLSLVVFGRIRLDLLTMVCALASGFGINTVVAPFFIASTARGVMRWNLLYTFMMATSVFVCGALLGPAFGAHGVVASIVGGVVSGSVVSLVGNAISLSATNVMRALAGTLALGVTAIAMIGAAGAVVFDRLFAG